MTDHARDNELSTTEHWEEVWSGDIRLRLPSGLVVATGNLQRLLRRYVRPGHRFIEIGCAPGKILAWVAAELHADVAGLDYSARGIAASRHLFHALNLQADLRCEDLGRTTFRPGSFDVVYSSGLIEHFADPREIVRQHLRLVKPGGTAVIAVPRYAGLYGRLQRYFDPENLTIHNLDIMSCEALTGLLAGESGWAVRSYAAGRMSPWLVNFHKKWPGPIAQGVSHAVNAVAMLQPVDITALSPMLVLEARRQS